MDSYNAVLSLFNITAEEAKGNWDGQTVNELVYVALDENSSKIRNQFTSLFLGRNAGVGQLQKHFEQSKKERIDPFRRVLKFCILAKDINNG